ncbi:hypothetical protein V8G54_037115 [Vigna mungo]|uniref:Transposase, Ptta/En/Spm, plant n=1 Tax=Vigna mungo TaxID=3915 RepID=A0AAQ3RF36_VIGMU
MSGHEPSRPDKGKTVKKARKAKYDLRVPSTIPFSNASTRPDVGSSRPPPPSTTPTPSVEPTTSTIGPTPSTTGPTPSTIGPTPSIVGPTPPIVVPTPSVVGPTPYIHPSSIPTPSSIPSPDVHQPSADVADPADTDDLDDPAPHDRPFIEPCGKGVTSQAITRTIKQQFLQPWASWGVISDDDKKLFWERFKQKVQWAAEHEAQIQKNFNMKASHRLSEMFRDARIAGQRPYWVGEHIWNSLLAHWNKPQYRIKCATAQKNRASEKGGALHTGGSITTHEHAIRMVAALGRAVHVDEVFTQTHIRKGTGEYVDERGGSGPDGRVDADEEMIRTQCWVDIVGGKKKGRLYGVGKLASHYSAGRGGIFRHQPSTSTTFDPNNVVSKDAYDSLLARFENLENLVRTLVPQQGHTALSSSQQPCPPQQPPFQTTAMQDKDSDDSDDPDNPDDYHRLSKLSTASRPSLNPHNFGKRYRGLQPLGNTDGFMALGIIEGFRAVGNTEGHEAVAVDKPSVDESTPTPPVGLPDSPPRSATHSLFVHCEQARAVHAPPSAHQKVAAPPP